MQSKPEKKTYETTDQAKNRIYRQKTEDMIIDDMLSEHHIVIDPVAIKMSKYSDSDSLVQDKYNLIAFSILSDDYEQALRDYPRGASSFSFEQFIATSNNVREYEELLVSPNGAPENSPAEIYDSIFAGDMGLMKQAALKGYQLKLEAMEGNV